MRVIAGEFRRRVLAAPDGLATRPTSDRLRETLFNILAPRIEGARFLDLYAGSGAVGIEALSRGAAGVVFVEKAQSALKVLRENLAKLGVGAGARVQAVGVATFLRSGIGAYDLVFLDPPYDAEEEYRTTLEMLGSFAPFPGSPNARDPHPSDEDLFEGTPKPGHPPCFLAEGAVVVAEHRRKKQLEECYGALVKKRLVEQGDASLSFYSREA